VSKFDEANLEEAILKYFHLNQNYLLSYGYRIERKNKDTIIEIDLRKHLLINYPDLTPSELQTIINKIKFIPTNPLYVGNKKAFDLISKGFDMPRDDHSKQPLHIDFINFEEFDNNVFRVVSQITIEGNRDRRPDLLIHINGIPVAIFEFKSAIREEVNIHEAWLQIHHRYNRDIPNLMKYCFISVISDGVNTKMGTIFTPYEYYYSWNKVNEEETVSNGISALLTMINGALSKERLVSLLRDFIYYPDTDEKELAIVARYPQFFASHKMLASIKKHLKPNGDGKGGTYFGSTGCGKTYTMLFLSRMLATHHREHFNSPTIIIIVDRDDLSKQTSKLFVNSKNYLRDENVKTIANRQALQNELRNNNSGGLYITTIQKFCESTGLLSERNNIICISDEAHRSQANTAAKLKTTDRGVETTYGFAKYLRDGFPNATYVGFTGTPIDETIYAFGDVVDTYTMEESMKDGITVRIQYEPRLARVILSDEQTKAIEKYYKGCIEEGANSEQVEESKKAMSQISKILNHPDRVSKLANDVAIHYEALCMEKPDVIQKAMIVCSSREHAFNIYQQLKEIRPDWFEAKKTENENLSKEELEKLKELSKVNLVATQGKDDEKALFDVCGNSSYRQMLDEQFKNDYSNFKIAIVVDMWITGFDVPSLTVMYIDKPLQKHTLIQTISRVNRVFEGKSKGLIVDYIGIKESMLEATKKYNPTGTGGGASLIDELDITLTLFRNQLTLINELLYEFDASDFYNSVPLARLMCLNKGAEYVQMLKDRETRFMGLSKRMKMAYEICAPSGELTDLETEQAQLYIAIRSIIYKQTKGHAPDAQIMNRVVQRMVNDAITCTGVEDIINSDTDELFSEDYLKQLDEFEMPITKFNALVQLLRKAIGEYGKKNKVKSIEFSERLKRVVEAYNNRDNQVFISDVVSDFINKLSDEVLAILQDFQEDQSEFKKLGITYEEKAFYDILVKVRNDNNFEYADEKCLVLAKEIKELVEDKSQYTDWSTRSDIKNQLNKDLTILLYTNGYPPEWDEEVFDRVMEQAENFKKYADFD